MNAPTLRTRLTLAATLAVGATLLLSAGDAGARERRGGMNRPAPHGDFQRHTERQRTDTGHTRQDTWTNANGKQVTRDATVVNDKDAGTRTREATTTLPDGRTRTLNDVTTKTENGYTRDTTITNPNGSTVQRDVTATKDPETGKWTKDVNVDRTPAPKPDHGG